MRVVSCLGGGGGGKFLAVFRRLIVILPLHDQVHVGLLAVVLPDFELRRGDFCFCKRCIYVLVWIIPESFTLDLQYVSGSKNA